MIYHVVSEVQWQQAILQGFYAADSLASEGFIHLSKKEQVQGVLNRYYKNAPNLLLLHIDEAKLKAEIKYELAASVNEFFPHLYGPLNLDAVITTTAISH
jgi:uncharacterized protein (DUF952 family)